jgi:hypothetical protein
MRTCVPSGLCLVLIPVLSFFQESCMRTSQNEKLKPAGQAVAPGWMKAAAGKLESEMAAKYGEALLAAAEHAVAIVKE